MGLFDILKKRDKKQLSNPEHLGKKELLDEFTYEMENSARSFIRSHSDRFGSLDFSVESLNIVDDILEEASDFYESMSSEQQTDLIRSAGSYVFEVARKTVGGQYFWYDQLHQPILVTRQPEFEVSILAFQKVKGRLENGEEDNIPFFFQGYVEYVGNKKSGMIV